MHVPIRSTRSRRPRGQGGAVVVEFALIAPVLLVLLMGIVDFGVNLSNQISLRQGVREAARQATVAEFGGTSSCGATFSTAGSVHMRELICLTKRRTGLIGTDVAVAVRFDPDPSSYPAPSGSTTPVGNGIVVCSAAPLTSVTKMFSPLLTDRYVRSRAVMRIEQASGVAEQQANEPDPTGENWAWCTP